MNEARMRAPKNYGHSSGTASDSICPKGWRLPGNEGDESWYGLVKFYANRSGSVGAADGPDRHYDIFVQIHPLVLTHSGLYNYSHGTLDSRDFSGGYWSSETKPSFFYFNSALLNPQRGLTLGTGRTLRCLAR